MKIKLLYTIIVVLIISNLFLVYNRSKVLKNSEFKREMTYLKNRIGFSDDQISEAKKEYRRYSKEKDSIEKKFRRLDLFIMNDISDEIDTNSINKDRYYEVAKVLNKSKMKHWINIGKISNEKQVEILDSIWSKTKQRISSQRQ
jgi:hypothetical protein|tara:strand:- start:634 stop:1065 length:432 start_codon:yes stop_codon:yes gene_type:complete